MSSTAHTHDCKLVRDRLAVIATAEHISRRESARHTAVYLYREAVDEALRSLVVDCSALDVGFVIAVEVAVGASELKLLRGEVAERVERQAVCDEMHRLHGFPEALGRTRGHAAADIGDSPQLCGATRVTTFGGEQLGTVRVAARVGLDGFKAGAAAAVERGFIAVIFAELFETGVYN